MNHAGIVGGMKRLACCPACLRLSARICRHQGGIQNMNSTFGLLECSGLTLLPAWL